jgi:phosphate-selective porin OprO/OprP
MADEIGVEADDDAEETEVLPDEEYRELTNEAAPTGEERREEQEEERRKEAEPAPPPEEVEPGAVRLWWERGIRIERNDKRFRMKISGRLMLDQAWIDGDSAIDSRFGDGWDYDVRRAWLDVSGVVRSRFIYKVQVDLAGNSAGDDDRNRYMRQTYVGWTIPGTLNGVRLGFAKEPFGMETSASNLSTVFMERALPNVFAPAYNLGILFNGQPLERRVSWWAGAFRYSGDSSGGKRLDLTGRVTGLAYVDAEDRKLLHVGGSCSHQFRDDFDLRYRRRPESHLADRYVDTGEFKTDDVDLVGVEVVGKWGPASFQSELIGSRVDRPGENDVAFWGGYLEASFFVTGEERPYVRRTGVFGRVGPRRRFDWRARSWGAWEVAARYSHVDLDHRDIRGGTMSDVTLGVNWYVLPEVRIMANYVRAHLNDVGDSNI